MIKEATSNFIRKETDPALLPFEEYYKIANERNKFHPSEAYDTSLEKLKQETSWLDKDEPESKKTLENRFSLKGLNFELYKEVTDKSKLQYLKSNKDGELIRTESGEHVYMTPDEIRDRFGKDVYETHFLVYDVTDGEKILVGLTQNEWGALLVRVAKEYSGMGLGKILVKKARGTRPEWGSGGFTNAGYNTFVRVWVDFVKEYLQSGFYSFLIKSGQIERETVKKIITDFKKLDKKTSVSEEDRKLDPKRFRMFSDNGQSYAILYDNILLQKSPDEIDQRDYWVERLFIGVITLTTYTEGLSKIDKMYGKSDKIKSLMIEFMLNSGDPLSLDGEQLKLVERLDIQNGDFNSNGQTTVVLKKKTMDVKKISDAEKKERKVIDPYDELGVRIHEIGESLAE